MLCNGNYGDPIKDDEDETDMSIPASVLKQLIKGDPLAAPSTPMRRKSTAPSTPKRTTTPPPTISQLGATPSPLMLNPMTEEDWSARQLSSNLQLSLVDDPVGKLVQGIKLSLYRDGERKPVTLRCDAAGSVLTISFDKHFEDEKKSEVNENNPIVLPISSVASINDSKTGFVATLKPSMRHIKYLEFECSSTATKGCVVRELGTLMSVNQPPQLKRRNSKVLAVQKSMMRQVSIVEGLISPSISKDEAADTPVSDDTTTSTCIRVHETIASLSMNHTTPSEQGMELTLVDPSSESTLTIPDLFIEDERQLKVHTMPGDFPILQVSSVTGGETSLNPWCANDVCSFTGVTDAFRDLFGVKEDESTAKVVEFRDPGDGCLHAALIVAEDIALMEHSGPLFLKSRKKVAKKAVSPIVPKPSRDMSKADLIRNRAENINSQVQHYHSLRNAVTFSAISDASGIPFLRTTRSLGEIEDTRPTDKSGRPKPPLKEFFLIQAVDDMFDQLIPDPESREFLATAPFAPNNEEDVLYYDSDPEHVRERTFRRGSRRTVAEHVNRPSHPAKMTPLQLPKEIIYAKSLTDVHIKTIVTLMKNCKMNLLWHPNRTKDAPFPKPMCVKAWIERGTYLMNQNFVQPKFMWKAAHEADLGSQRKVNLLVEKVDLLEIFRIDSHLKNIDRQTYPLAHQPCCFSVKTKTNYFLFQASTKKEKAHIVFGLKLMVARLASLLIVRDMAAVEEFFESVEAAVPGQVPFWIQGKQASQIPE